MIAMCLAASILTGAACGASDAAAPAGLVLAEAKGCTSCHGANGGGGVAPAWSGIAGETVTLIDGSTVVRDRDYFVRALVDPQGEQVAPYTVAMPKVRLTEVEIETLVDYLEGLE